MVAMEFRFPAGRYHATPWNHHVNEGVVEWPPSPWRVLRAITATWHLKAHRDVGEDILVDLLTSLSEQPPNYHLPRATGAHTRHYLPQGAIEKGSEKTAKVFDTFLQLDADAVVRVVWPDLILSEDGRRGLSTLLERMSYLGRAEAWTDARLAEGSGLEDGSMANVAPLSAHGELRGDQELVRVLCPMREGDVAAWRARAAEIEVERRLTEKRAVAEAKGKDPARITLTKADRRAIEAALPATLVDALCADTRVLHQHGWSGVPGARWVDYVRPKDMMSVDGGARRPRQVATHPTVARFAVASQVSPRLTEALSLSERLRVALMSRSTGAPVFSGRGPSGDLLQGNRHAYIVPEASGRHGRITHVTLYAPMGFDESARRALDGLRKVWGRGGHDVQLVLLGVGQPDDFVGLDVGAGQCPLFARSTVWVSMTPFVATRHPKVNHRGEPKVDENGMQIGSPRHDLVRLLGELGCPVPVSIEPIALTDLGGKRTPWLDFTTIRQRGGGRRSGSRGCGFRIVFAEAVAGPLVVGYAAHFGLGVFMPGS
jgi:CRISPR-associated protein Csb2